MAVGRQLRIRHCAWMTGLPPDGCTRSWRRSERYHSGVTGGPTSSASGSGSMLLHIGVHKTGTTAVQTALANSRDILDTWQVRYPGRLMAHREVASSVMGRPLGWRTDGAKPPKEGLWGRTVAEARAYRGTTVISSEFFAESPEDVVGRIVADVGPDRLQVVITLRNLGRILPSAWQQNLKSGFETAYLPWIRRMLFTDDEATRNTIFWRRHRHDELVERWVAAAGADHVTVVVVDDRVREGIFHHFEDLLDLPRNTLYDRRGEVSNRSMTLAEAAFLRRLNVAVGGAAGWRAYPNRVQAQMVKHLVEGRAPGPDEARLATPQWALDRAAEIADEMVTRIEATGARILGDPGVLRERMTGPEEAVDDSAEMPTDAAISALLGALDATRSGEAGGPEAGGLTRRARRWLSERGR